MKAKNQKTEIHEPYFNRLRNSSVALVFFFTTILVQVSAQKIIFNKVIPSDGNSFTFVKTVIEQVTNTKRNEFPEADAMLIFSCVGRYNSFGPLVNTEIEGIQKVWDVPMAGFFSFGEFGRSPGGQSEVHGTTCSWMALKGK
jgi:hypothetical protein